MSKDTSRCSIQHKQTDNIPAASCKHKLRGKYRKHTLECISKQHKNTVSGPQCPENIGRTGVFASVVPYIYSLEPSYNITCLDESERISKNKTYDTLHYFSPLSRIMNLSGVPLKPKASLI